MVTQTKTTSKTKVAVTAALLIVGGAAFAAGAHCVRSNSCAYLLPGSKRAVNYGYNQPSPTPAPSTGYGYAAPVSNRRR